ncbi:MAG: HIT domain-containing protein [Symbiobacteriaceae bacterium]|nr:HIT domain-containing protein [Symbiobacteriaceae bacterium]
MIECIFCRILTGELPAQVYYQDESWMVIADINPQAEVHLLFISRVHKASFADLSVHDAPLLGSLISTIGKVTGDLGITSYKLLTNVGEEAGQTISHLHWHLLAGKGCEILRP